MNTGNEVFDAARRSAQNIAGPVLAGISGVTKTAKLGNLKNGTQQALDPPGESLHQTDQPSLEDMDILDFAAAYTIISRGKVYVLQAGQMPGSETAATVFRY